MQASCPAREARGVLAFTLQRTQFSLNFRNHKSNNRGKQLSPLWQGSVPGNVGYAELWGWIFTSHRVNTAEQKHEERLLPARPHLALV